MRNSKIVALVATAALLVLGAAFTSMAATYSWYQVDGIWHCKDKYGDDYNQAFAKSGNDMYWLDENGEMATDLFLEEDGNYYYFDSEGKMVKNDWKKLIADDEEDEENWYYFQTNGKAIKGKFKPVEVKGKKYLFADDGKMLYGWVDEVGQTDGDNDGYWAGATYYCGGEDDGAVRFGWQQIDVIDEREDLDEQTYWFYFGTNGKKVEAATNAKYLEKTINGKKYAFDETGKMTSEWQQTECTPATASTAIGSYAWFHTAEDGAKMKKGWFRVIPKDLVNATANEDEEYHWFYANGDGTLAENQIKTIKGKKYGFDENGEMISGLWGFTSADFATLKVSDGYPVDEEDEVSKVNNGTAGAYAYVFFGDEETDGSMKTGTVKTEIDGDEYTFFFGTTGASKYFGKKGFDKNAYYVNGHKVAANDDYKYQLFEVTNTDPATEIAGWGTKSVNLKNIKINPEGEPVVANVLTSAAGVPNNTYVLISSSGTFVKNATAKKDADGYKFTVENYKVTKIEK